MKLSRRERNILVLAGVVAVVFMLNSVLPAIGNWYQQRQGNIEQVSLDIEREQRLIEEAARWRERRVEVETLQAELQSLIFAGETVPLIEADIQRDLSTYARESGISVSSTRLAELLQTGDWLMISQEMSFRTTDAGSTIQFLQQLEESEPRLLVTDFSVNRSRSQYSGAVTVVGFARAENLTLQIADNRR